MQIRFPYAQQPGATYPIGSFFGPEMTPYRYMPAPTLPTMSPGEKPPMGINLLPPSSLPSRSEMILLKQLKRSKSEMTPVPMGRGLLPQPGGEYRYDWPNSEMIIPSPAMERPPDNLLQSFLGTAPMPASDFIPYTQNRYGLGYGYKPRATERFQQDMGYGFDNLLGRRQTPRTCPYCGMLL